MIYREYLKRLFDTILAGLTLVVLSPVMLLVAILVRINLGSPVIFKQNRPGKNEKIFKLYKFRSMSDERDKNGELLPDTERLTSFGRTLRKLSVDELPELFNILKGEMALVGPRPLAVQYLPYYTKVERKRHSVRPGLTGLAQVNGRNATTWEKRFAYDVKYAKNVTFLGDVNILLRTIAVVLSRNGVGERGVDSLVDFDKYREQQETTKE